MHFLYREHFTIFIFILQQKSRGKSAKPFPLCPVSKLFVDSVFESGTGLEGGNLGGSDLDLFAGTGVFALSCLALASLEGTETDQLNLVVLGNGFFDYIKSGVKNLAGLLLGNVGLFCDCIDEFLFVIKLRFLFTNKK